MYSSFHLCVPGSIEPKLEAMSIVILIALVAEPLLTIERPVRFVSIVSSFILEGEKAKGDFSWTGYCWCLYVGTCSYKLDRNWSSFCIAAEECLEVLRSTAYILIVFSIASMRALQSFL